MARCYLDEDTPREVGSILTRYGHDVVHAYDLGNQGITDAEHLQLAANAGRILVTYNRRDFEDLHRLWVALNAWEVIARQHAGILTTWGQIPIEPWADLINDFLALRPSITNVMWRWQRQQRQWQPVG